MSKIKLPHASGNSVSIAAPATNPAADRTINLNDNYAGDGSFVTANSSGNVGLNTASPSTKLSLEGSDGSTSNGILIGAKNAGGIRGAIEVHTAASTVGFNLSRTGGGSDTDVVRLEMDGDSNGLIQVRNSSNTQRVRLDNHGIKFGTDTAEVNALDDYEEGSWTPTGNGFPTISNEYGKYVKIGNVVHAWWQMEFSTDGSSSHAHITNLPFTSANNGPYGGGTAWDYRTSSTLNVHVSGGSTLLYFYHDDGSNCLGNHTKIEGKQFRACTTYRVS